MSGATLSNSKPETGSFFQRDLGWHPPAFTPQYKTSVLRSPQKALISLDNTLSEITGPVFGHNILGEFDNDLIHNFAKPGESAIGPRIIVYGRVHDERGKGVANTLVEFWQANAGGRYRHKKDSYAAPLDPNFGGCGRTITGPDGSKPGMVRGTEPAASSTLVPASTSVEPSAFCTVTVRSGPSEPVPSMMVIFFDFMKPLRLLTMPSTIFCLRAWATAKLTTGADDSMPNSAAWATWRWTAAVSRNALAGMHPRLRQVPPIDPFSTTATLSPAEVA